jgi:xanthine dehydrogenase YagS FAD-binding subunit
VQAEDVLRGEVPTRENFLRAADVELAAAKPTEANAFKIELAKRTMAAVLGDLTGAGA